MVRPTYLKTVVACILVSGCAIFAPPYKQEADTQISNAYQQISEITACIDLGLCATADSFKEKETNYTKAISSLKSAYLIASNWQASRKNLPATEANEYLLEIVKGCETSLVNLSELHKTAGIPAGIGAAQPVDISCDQAVRAIRANK